MSDLCSVTPKKTYIDTSLWSPIIFSERRLSPVLSSLVTLLPQLNKGLA
jgi:hypothetical protein